MQSTHNAHTHGLGNGRWAWHCQQLQHNETASWIPLDKLRMCRRGLKGWGDVKEKVSDRRAAAPVCEFIEKNKQLGGAQRARKGRGTWGGAAKTSSRVFRQMRAHRLPFGAQFRFRFQFKFESQFRFHFLPALPTFQLTHRLGLLQLQLLHLLRLRMLHERAVRIRTPRFHLGAHGEHLGWAGFSSAFPLISSTFPDNWLVAALLLLLLNRKCSVEPKSILLPIHVPLVFNLIF